MKVLPFQKNIEFHVVPDICRYLFWHCFLMSCCMEFTSFSGPFWYHFSYSWVIDFLMLFWMVFFRLSIKNGSQKSWRRPPLFVTFPTLARQRSHWVCRRSIWLRRHSILVAFVSLLALFLARCRSNWVRRPQSWVMLPPSPRHPPPSTKALYRIDFHTLSRWISCRFSDCISYCLFYGFYSKVRPINAHSPFRKSSFAVLALFRSLPQRLPPPSTLRSR